MNLLALFATIVVSLFYPSQGNLDSGLVAYYPLNGSVRDESGFLRDGTAYGPVSYVLGPWGEQGTAINFNGANTHVLLPSNGINLGDDAYSFGFYFSISDITKASQTLINTVPHTGATIGFHTSSRKRRIYVYLGNCVGWTVATNQLGARNSFRNNQWYHLAFTKQAGLYSMYIDGQLDLEIYLAASPSINCQPQFRLGDIQCCNFPAYLNGKISDFVFYKSRVLSPAYIKTHLMVKNPFANSSTVSTKTPSLSPSLSSLTPNNPPVIVQQIPSTYARVGELFQFVIPADTFTDKDGDTLALSAMLANNSALPSWLSFYPDGKEFLGKPKIEDVADLQIKVVASDGNGGQISDVFFLVVTNDVSNPTSSGRPLSMLSPALTLLLALCHTLL